MGKVIRDSKKLAMLLLLIGQSTLALASGDTDAEAFAHTAAVADKITWVVLFVVPIVSLTVFWKIHIFPEKVAEERNHPHKDAIAALCILSLFIGGLLWPIAVVWAYARPIMVYTRDAKHREEDEQAYLDAAEKNDEEDKE